MLLWHSRDQRWAMTGHSEGGASTVREPLAAHRHLLARSVLLTQKDDKARILILEAEAPTHRAVPNQAVFIDGKCGHGLRARHITGGDGHFVIERLAAAWLGALLNDAAVHSTQLAAFVPG